MSTRRFQAGFTLVELIAAIAVMSVLMLAMSSALVIASRALPSESRPATRVMRTNAALQRIADELAEAIAITERGSNAVAFTVADRDGDGNAERIRYLWSGTAGTALTRSYNGGTPVTVVSDVYAFALAYVLRSDAEIYPGPLVDSAQQLFSSFDNNSTSSDFIIQKKTWIGQAVAPTLPANAVSWTVDRAKFLLKKKGPDDGEIAVQVRTLGANGMPTTTVLDAVTVKESWLGSNYAWRDMTYAGTSLLTAGTSGCVVLVPSNDKGESGQTPYNGNTGGGFLETSNAESGWQINGGKGLRHYIYGHYHAPAPDQSAIRRYVTTVNVALQVGADAKGKLQAAVHAMNEPELLRAYWEIESGQTPAADRNGDGTADFNTSTALVMNPDLLMNGSTSWTIPVTGTIMTTQPVHDFADLITVHARFRDLVANDKQPAMICVNADWSGANNAQIYAGLELDNQGTQKLLVSGPDAGAVIVTFVSVDGLPAGLVDLRLIVDPALNTVNIRVNGASRGTFSYATNSRLTMTKYLQFAPWSSLDAEFARVTVRVGDRTP